MIRLFFLLFLLALTPWGVSAKAATPEQLHSEGISLCRTTADFGTIRPGDKCTTTFPFTADADVVVVFSATTNCDCTKATYPRKPLRRGAKNSITVDFDAQKPGYFCKIVTVKYIAGDKQRTATLTVSGTVVGHTPPQ